MVQKSDVQKKSLKQKAILEQDRKSKKKLHPELKEYELIKKNPKLKAVFWVIFAISTLLLVSVFRFYVRPALFALLIFIILNPIYIRISVYMKGREGLTSIFVVVGSLFVIFLPSVYILISISVEAVKASKLLKESVKTLTINDLVARDSRIWRIFGELGIKPDDIITRGFSFAQKAMNFIVQNLTEFVTGSFGLLFDIIIMAVILFFLLKESKKISAIFYDLMPFPYEMEHRIVSRIERVIRDVFYGNLVIMSIQGLGLFILLLSFGVPSAILWAVIGGLFSIIPIISTSIVWIPAVIFFIIQENFFSAVFFGILALAIAQVLENIVKPKILDKKLNIHPLILFFSLFGGMQAFGLVGLILGPAVVTLFVSFLEAYRVIEEFTPAEEKKSSIFFKPTRRQ